VGSDKMTAWEKGVENRLWRKCRGHEAWNT